MKYLTALLVGATFGLGIALSGMANPAKVLNFFDVFGTWDPSLGFVMFGAMITTAIGYKIVFARRPKPVFEPTYSVPTNRKLDTRLIAGSAVFGIGWGITGFCPGGAIPALGLGEIETFYFVASMMAGVLAARTYNSMLLSRAHAASTQA